MKKIFTVLILLLFVLAVAGCKEEGTAAKKTVATKGAASQDSSDTGSADVSAEEGSDGGFFDKFTDVIKAKTGVKYMVEYKFDTNRPDNEIDSMTQYYGGPNKFRMDSDTSRGAGRVYILSSGFYSCTQQGGAWQCLKMADSSGMSMDPSEQFKDIEAQPDRYDIKSDGTKMVAGTLAKCFKITMNEGTFRECFSKEGVPLYMLSQVKVGGQSSEMEMTATKYSTNVKDSDFTLPAEAQDLSAMMAGRGQMPSGYADPSAYEDMDASDYSDEE